ncbi:MAG TPA: ATP-binding protein [Gemmata sp.]|nr:ATP-binding protein [Gemmata sp.]
MSPLATYVADHPRLVAAAAHAAGIANPLAFAPSTYLYYLLKAAIRGPLVPLEGVLVRDWLTGGRHYWPGTKFGVRLYTAKGIRFARVVANIDGDYAEESYEFFVVDRSEYVKLFRIAVRASRQRGTGGMPPVMAADQLEILRQNTIGYLDRQNLKRIRELGGRPKRGLLLTGPPGNGKTSACRWLLNECLRLGFEHKEVTPDAYQAARKSCNPVAAVKDLFAVNRRGVIFFDDMDVALRDRNTVQETDDQAVFLGALDGIDVNEGVVYVFTTNCPLSLIDPAFKRPGRIDLVLHFDLPDAALRRTLIGRWHGDVRRGIDLEKAAELTEGFSFAEVEEVKNLLILRYVDTKDWDWDWAMAQFHLNRQDLTKQERHVGFASTAISDCNGDS